MEDDKFRFTKSNYICLTICVVSIITLIISSILLIHSLKYKNNELPYLNVTKGRTSTKEKRTTTDQTTTTTTTTAFVEMSSPYYIIDANNYYNDELLSKENITKEEAKEIISLLVKYANQVINPSDNSLLDITTTVNHAHTGEVDMKELNGNKYGIVYDGYNLLNKIFYSIYTRNLGTKTINGVKSFIVEKSNIYRVENLIGNLNFEIVDIALNTKTTSELKGTITYYKSNYKEEGYSSPVYKNVELKAIYNNGRWKVYEYDFPLFD